MFSGGGTLKPVDLRPPPMFGPWLREEDYGNIRSYRLMKAVSNETHRAQLKMIDSKLNELCRQLDVHLLSVAGPVEERDEEVDGGHAEPAKQPIVSPKAPEPVKQTERAMQPVALPKAPEPAQIILAKMAKPEKEETQRLLQFIQKAGLTEAFMNSRTRKDPAIKVMAGDYFHSPLVMAEIKSTLFKVNVFQQQEIAWFEDQLGITWGISFMLDSDVLVLQLHTTKCPEIFGNFRLMLKFIHESPFKSFPQSIQMTVRDRLSAYTTPIANIMQMVQDGYMTQDGVAQIRVSIVSIDADTDRSCTMWLEQSKAKFAQQHSQKKPQKTPRFCSNRFAVTNYTITHVKNSPKLLDSKRCSWQLVVSMNRHAESNNRDHISLVLKRCDNVVLDGCFEYFVELCPPHGPDGKPQSGHRHSGRITTGSELIANFIAKSQLQPYLKNNTLQFWWGLREVPVR